ncbi:MAG: Tektin 1 [Marteilia pararefringens]
MLNRSHCSSSPHTLLRPRICTAEDYEKSNFDACQLSQRSSEKSELLLRQVESAMSQLTNEKEHAAVNTLNELDNRIKNLELHSGQVKSSIERINSMKKSLKSECQEIGTFIMRIDRPLAANDECLGLRQQRDPEDLIDDEVDVRLGEEREILSQSQCVLREDEKKMNEKIRECNKMIYKLEKDMKTKNEAIGTDRECLSLKREGREYLETTGFLNSSEIHSQSNKSTNNAGNEEIRFRDERVWREKNESILKNSNDLITFCLASLTDCQISRQKILARIEESVMETNKTYQDSRNHMRKLISNLELKKSDSEAKKSELKVAIDDLRTKIDQESPKIAAIEALESKRFNERQRRENCVDNVSRVLRKELLIRAKSDEDLQGLLNALNEQLEDTNKVILGLEQRINIRQESLKLLECDKCLDSRKITSNILKTSGESTDNIEGENLSELY